MEIYCMENIPSYLATMDLVKAFDSLYRDFLLCVLKKVGFGDDFTNWVKTLLNDQPSCIINAGLLLTISHQKEVLTKVIQYQHIFL